MRFPNRGGFSSRGGSSSYQRGSGRGFDRPEMHDAVCAKCGADCQVPFAPSGRREVFCSKCFETMGGGDRPQREFRDSRGPRSFRSEERYPRRAERSFGDRPASDNNNPPRPSNSVALAAINEKLDKIMKLLADTNTKPKKEVKVAEKEAKKVKAVKKEVATEE